MSDKLTRMRLGERFEESLTDWARLDALTDEEIAAAIRDDPDAFEPEPGSLEHALVVRASRPRQRLTLRLDADLVEWFKAQGAGYQARINAVLRAYVERAQTDALSYRPPPLQRQLEQVPLADRTRLLEASSRGRRTKLRVSAGE
jgi:uncharacterized protein (DUF4415 family)